MALRKPLDRKTGGAVSAAGMTLIELLVTLALVAFFMAAVFSVFGGVSRTFTGQSQLGEVQTSVQIGLNDLLYDLTNAGFNGPERIIRYDEPVGDPGACPDSLCPLVFLQASDWQVTFLADLNGTSDGGTKDSPAFLFQGYSVHVCTSADCSTSTTKATTDAQDFHSEIVRWGLDSSGDAIRRVVSVIAFPLLGVFDPAPNVNCAGGAGDCDVITPNPNDYMLLREIDTNAAVDGEDTPFAFGIRGAAADGTFPVDEANRPIPLFQYWVDRDEDGELEGNDCDGVDDGASQEAVLYGDDNFNCVLDTGEVPVGSVAADDLRRILRVVVTMRVESRTPASDYEPNGGYRFNIVRGAAQISNQELYYRQKD